MDSNHQYLLDALTLMPNEVLTAQITTGGDTAFDAFLSYESNDQKNANATRKRKSSAMDGSPFPFSSRALPEEQVYEPASFKLKTSAADFLSNGIVPPPTTTAIAMVHGNANATNSDDTHACYMLHTACKLFPTNLQIVTSALVLEPGATRQRTTSTSPCSTASHRNRHGITSADGKKGRGLPLLREQYSLPLNIALSNHATYEVVEAIVTADPSVVLLKDGTNKYNQLTSMHVALHSMKSKAATTFQKRLSSAEQLKIVSLLLETNRDCASSVDCKFNYPLHTACQLGLSLDIIKLLYQYYPNATKKRNFNHLTPLEIIQKNSSIYRSTDEILNFMQNKI